MDVSSQKTMIWYGYDSINRYEFYIRASACIG